METHTSILMETVINSGGLPRLAEHVIETLELTQPEGVLLCCLLLAAGEAQRANALASENGIRERHLPALYNSLTERQLIEQREGGWSLDGLSRAVQVLDAEEEKSIKLVLRSLRQRVLALARSAPLAAGLGRVYTFVFGAAPVDAEYAVLGLMGKELGRDAAALFLLEQAHQEASLRELLPLARARAARVRPLDAPREEEQRAYQAALAAQTRARWSETAS